MMEKIEKLALVILPWIVVPAMLASLYAVFALAPTDKALGISQRIFYFHVPSATSCYAAFFIAGVASALFLRTRNSIWDHAAHAAVSVGMLFATIVMVTGAIWARTAWGTWWTWDARLTTFLVLWLVFAGYLLLRSMASDEDMTPRYSAVLAIAGALNIPLVMMATRLWRTIHPQVINNPQGGIDDPNMVLTLLLSMAAIFSTFTWLLALRVRTLRLEERADILLADSEGLA